MIPLPQFVLKIAALGYRSSFFDPQSRIGLELGADISTAQDLDDYYVYDKNPDLVASIFEDILYRHLKVGLQGGELDNYGVSRPGDLAKKMFTQKKVFAELARAAEGVVRDLINIFTKSFFHAQRTGRKEIIRKSVQIGAQEWLEEDKNSLLDPPMRAALRQIVDKVIGKKKARSFMVSRELEGDWLLRKLIDARVLHLMKRG